MGTLSKEFFSNDLDFLIAETGVQIVGVSPARIAGVNYVGAFRSIDMGIDLELHGMEDDVDTEIIINRNKHSSSEIPSKGSILKDDENNLFKVFKTTSEDFGSVVTLQVVSKYAREP